MSTGKDHCSIKNKWARRVLREKLRDELTVLKKHLGATTPVEFLGDSENFTHDNLPRDPNYENGKLATHIGEHPQRKVCIVGAGVAGLYIAMILDSLKEFNVSYDILEANSRVGGRLYTHYFSERPHDYYDIGAMRYPKIDTMKRTFDLFELTGVKLIPYYLSGKNTPSMFNDRFGGDGFDPYHVSVSNGGSVPDEVIKKKMDDILNEAFSPYKQLLADNFNNGFKELLKVDDFSTREYLRRGGPDGKRTRYDFPAIQWMETQDTSTNLFDQAFSESVIDSFDFDNPKPDTEWKCILGGTSDLSERMRNMLSTQIQTKKRVEKISISRQLQVEGNMSVKCVGEEDPRTGYATVFNTTTLGCLGRMDLRDLDLHPSQKDAIRSLHYDDSAKVALKFSYPWWIVDCGITKGGVASTDIPLRTCVYPSYNLHDGPDKEAVLLASYTWAQDATRMGSLVNGTNEDELVELILRDLARLHAQTISYEKIKEAYNGVHHAHSWSHDPFTSGAFALFGPGQFRHLYPYLKRPAADSKFHIVGEASSVHHAWIVGALNSAYTAVYSFFYRYRMFDAIAALKDKWGTVDELEEGEFGTVHLQVMLGTLTKKQQYKV